MASLLRRNVLQTCSLRQVAGQTLAPRFLSTKSIHDELADIIPERLELAKKLKSEHGDKKLGDVQVSHVFGGMRGLKSMLWDPSVLDSEEGIRFWGRTIPECQQVLPSAKDGSEMLPESMFWYLLTGKVPSEKQVEAFQADLAERSTKVPKFIEKLIDSFPKTLHPMTQFVMATAALNHNSKFAAAYSSGIKKSDYWKTTLEDSLDLAAMVYPIAARIYTSKYKDSSNIPAINKSKDLSWNYAQQIGFGDSQGFIEAVRLYNALHTDHEGGNVSAHTTHLVGSALSDPYLSYSAALAGLAGPLHGLANQEALRFVLEMKAAIGSNAGPEQVKEHVWKVLKSGRVVPGYGHAVLRKPDPRFEALREFGNKRPEVAADPVFKIVDSLFQVAPGVLTEHGKTKNPFPNVDAASGCLLYHYGMTEFEYYTVLFGCSRAMGALSQLVWDRVHNLPIERPKSLSMEAIAKIVGA